MDRTQFEQFSQEMKDEVQEGDYAHDDVTTIPIIRVHQDKTQDPPENSDVGMFYSPTAGFVHPSTALRATIMDVVNIRQLWTPWKASDKHIICKCFDQATGVGTPFVEEDGRWVTGEESRECVACPYNAFRSRALEPIDILLYNGKPLSLDEHCASGKIFVGFLLPDPLSPTDEQVETARQAHIVIKGDDTNFDTMSVAGSEPEVTLETVLPFYFQFGSTIFSNAYTRLLNSWEAFVVGCKTVNPPLPWMACKLRLTTAKVDTANGPVFAPVFDLEGVHLGALTKIRAVAGAYKERLALKSADVQPDIAPEAPGA